MVVTRCGRRGRRSRRPLPASRATWRHRPRWRTARPPPIPSAPVPFVFEQWVPDHRLVVKRNDDYWQTDKPYLDELEFRPIADNVTRSAAFASGALDMLVTYEPSDVTAYRSTPEFRVLTDRRGRGDGRGAQRRPATVRRPGGSPRRWRKATDRARSQRRWVRACSRPPTDPSREGEPWYSADTHVAGLRPRRRRDVGRRTTELEPASALALPAVDLPRSDEAAPGPAPPGDVDPRRRRGADRRRSTRPRSSSRSSTVSSRPPIISNFGTADPDFNYLFWHSSLVAPPGQLSINFSHTVDPSIDAALDAARRTDDIATRARTTRRSSAAERRRRLRLALPHPDDARRIRRRCTARRASVTRGSGDRTASPGSRILDGS